jgi:hypothetical protein
MELLIGENEMTSLLMNDTVVWGLIGLGVLLLGWLWWPKKTVTETLEEVKAEEKIAPVAAVNDQITDAVTNTAKKTRAKKTAAPKKTAAKKAPAKKAAPKKAVKKGRK